MLLAGTAPAGALLFGTAIGGISMTGAALGAVAGQVSRAPRGLRAGVGVLLAGLFARMVADGVPRCPGCGG